MTMPTTIHMMSQGFDPANYDIVEYLDNKRPEYCGGPVEAYVQEIKYWQEEMARTLGADWQSKKNHCAHCHNGSVRWITVATHVPTGERVVFGNDCTERLGFANRDVLKVALMQKRAEARGQRLKIWLQAQAFIKANPVIAEVQEAMKLDAHKDNRFVADILAKLLQYGSLSERQVACLKPSLQRDIDTAARKAAEATEVKGDAPEGRVEVTGDVLSVQTRESDFGPVVKMLVKLANNSKVWMTVPGGSGIKRTDKVTVRATFERSRDDRSFGFGKRPTVLRVEVAA